MSRDIDNITTTVLVKEARSLTKLQQITVKQPKTVATTPKTAKKSPKSGVASDYSYGHTAEFETTIPTIDTIDTPTVKTTEKIYTDEVAKKVDISGESGIIKIEKNDNTYKKFNTGEEVNEYFGGSGGILERQKSVEKQWLKFLTSEEKSAISEYCADGYFDINTYLREMPGAEYINAEAMKSFANDLDSAINKFELKDNIVVYRGIENNALKRIDLNNAVGSIYEDDGYMSTSPIQIDLIARKDAILEIRVPAGKGRGAYVNSLSGFKDEEYEFLLKRGTRCKINAVDTSGEKPIIKMEVIK